MLDPIMLEKTNGWLMKQLNLPKGLKSGPKIVFVDESATKDGKSVAVCGIIVRQQDVSEVREKLRNIQQRVAKAMHEYGYPIVDPVKLLPKDTSRCRTERKRISSGGLPELHATELWNSSDVFQTSRPPPPGQFERHLSWIEEALSLLSEYEIFFRPHFTMDVDHTVKKASKYNTSVYDQLRDRGRLTEDIRKKLAEGILFNPYFGLQMSMLIAIDANAQHWGWTVELIGDKGKETEYLKKLVAAFDRLKTANLLDTFPIPDFMNSDEEPMLQLADLATYIFFKHQTAKSSDWDYEFINPLFERYIAPRILSSLAPNIRGAMTDNRHYAIYRAIQVEITLVHAGLDQKTLQLRKKIADEEISDIVRDLKSGRLHALIPRELIEDH
jgi:Protein of unknown function (DUF3800)